MKQAEIQDEVDQFIDRCRETGYRVTPQRVEIFKESLMREDHPDADSIYAEVSGRFPAISPDTVYRTLELLEDLGFIRRVNVLAGRVRFDSRTDEHHHFVCRSCGKIKDFESEEADRISLPDDVHSFGEVESVRIEVRGLCEQCREEQNAG